MALDTWSSRLTFMLTASGAAVGLGNLWRFPFMAGENGGGAFVLVYIVFVVVIGIPIMVAEMMIGRSGGAGAVESMRRLQYRTSSARGWQMIGWLSIVIPLAGLSFYSVVGGWALAYIAKAGVGEFTGLDAQGSGQLFAGLLGQPGWLIFWHAAFMISTCLLVGRGLQRGIEWVGRLLMPALFLLLVLLVVYAAIAADFAAAVRFLFSPDFSALTPQVVLMALGQAFFSLAVGVGALVTYSAYLPASVSLPRSAASVALIDTAVALLAGLAIFPLVFSYGLNPGGGPGLIFETLPIAFGQMPAGALVGTAFFILLYCAAFSTAVGMLEPVVAWLRDSVKLSRWHATLLAGGGIWVLGIAAALSFNVWADIRLLPSWTLTADKSIFDLLDFITSNLLIPLNGLLIALFAGWKLAPVLDKAPMSGAAHYWLTVVRWLAPLAIFLVLYTGLG